MTTTSVLVDARRLLEDVGWVQKESVKFEPIDSNLPFYPYDDHNKNTKIVGYCLAGALDAARLRTNAGWDDLTSAHQLLTEILNPRWQKWLRMPNVPITIWNDNPKREKKDVLNLLDRAIVKSMEK